jgi:hypothetical protein
LGSKKPVHPNARPEMAVEVSDVIFHGDSMSRDLFGVVNMLLGVSAVSGDKLKKKLNANIANGVNHCVAGVGGQHPAYLCCLLF